MRGTVVVADAMMSGGDGQPETLAGVTVTLDGEHAMGETMETGENGSFLFTGLRAGTYTVTISDFPEDVSFETVSVEVEVEVGGVGNADFTGHFIRTSAVEGEVIIDGRGLAGVTVTLIGGPADENFTTMTDSDGMYRFEDLRPGDYTVSISDFDTRDYNFAVASQDVSVDLGETATVPFTGQLLRTSAINGRVSVEGMGLSGIEVTLSGGDTTRTETTDAGGQYGFAGLAAGDYTVSIAVDDPAYVFDEMSKTVTVGDNQSAIVPFDGAHARTASVSGRFFIDELDKNDMMDAGELAVPAPDVRVDLVGPGVGQTTSTETGPDGSFMFSGLREGTYQLIVPIDATAAAALAANDVAYGGEAAGYRITLGVGEAASQDIPLDITHTTVNFTVSLRSGDEMGDALPGASVSLYGANSAMVGSGMTGDDGSVAIKVARAMTSGNMVNAGVSAEGYHVADGMTEVSWDPQMFATEGSNSNDIVNLNVDVNISGATVSTDYGGGEALAGWAIDVMMGDAAVAGAPTALGDDGSAAFTTTVESVPASFTFEVADDQVDELDGGEMYQASGGTYTHTGLSVAGTMDADPIVVTYTTQTLKVYVHRELDQVYGYTGNVGYGDERKADLVDLEIRQAIGNDGRRTSQISNDDWDARANSRDNRGTYTFSHLPADMNIVVHATARDGYQLLDLHGLDTYRNLEENGVMGGAFGDMGGWGHTVTLCPLTETEPTGQDFGKCGSFAVVSLYDVSANVSKNGVRESGVGFSTTNAADKRAPGITVSLTPVEGKNLAGVGREFTTAKSNDPTTEIDERTDHNFGTMAAGAYKLGLPDGWRGTVTVGDADPVGAAGKLDPLASNVALDITPSTATLYGFVRNADNAGLDRVTVTVNGQTATTDGLGRYIVSGISRVRPGDNQLFVNTARADYPETKPDSTNNPDTEVPEFMANSVKRWDFELSGANNTVTITGTVAESGTGAPIPGVRIMVDGKNPLNGEPSGSKKGQLLTEENGTYTAVVATQPFDDPLVHVTVSKSGWHFVLPPDGYPVPATAGSNPTADFQGTKVVEITGRVAAPGGNVSMSDVTVTAYGDAGMTDSLHAVTTTETGTFSVKVPPIQGVVYLKAEPRELKQSDYSDSNYQNLVDAQNYVWFDPPTTRPGGAIAVLQGQVMQFGTFKGYSVQPRITSVTRGKVKGASVATPPLVNGEDSTTIVVKWEYDTRSDGLAADGSTVLPYNVAPDAAITVGGTAGSPALATLPPVDGATVTPNVQGRNAERTNVPDGTAVTHKRTTTVTIDGATAAQLANYGKRNLTVGVVAVGADVAEAAAEATSAEEELDAVAHGASGVTVTRDGNATAAADAIAASWSGPGSPGLEHRVALRVKVGTQNDLEWVVVPDGVITAATLTRNLTPGGTDFGKWELGDIVFATDDIAITAITVTAAEWLDDDNGNSYANLDLGVLRVADQLRVDTRVTGTGDWKKGTPVAIPPSG